MVSQVARPQSDPTLRRRGAFRRLLSYPAAAFGLIVITAFFVMAALAPVLAPHDPTRGDLLQRLQPPAWAPRGEVSYFLGTDQLGRDVLSQAIHGARVSLTVGLGVVAASGLIGGLLGLIAGFYRGTLDDVLARLADWTLAFPFIILAILLMGVLGPGIVNLIVVLSIAGWPHFFRLIRGEVLVEREKAYVEAAFALGKSPFVIMIGEIVRNIMHTFLVVATIRLGIAILSEASLSYLGFGVPPDMPAWGTMVAYGQRYVEIAWWLSAVPGLAILSLVLSVNLVGEGLRDALDPRLRE